MAGREKRMEIEEIAQNILKQLIKRAFTCMPPTLEHHKRLVLVTILSLSIHYDASDVAIVLDAKFLDMLKPFFFKEANCLLDSALNIASSRLFRIISLTASMYSEELSKRKECSDVLKKVLDGLFELVNDLSIRR